MRKAIMFACDRGFLPYTIFAIRRIQTLEPDAQYDICVCSGTLSQDDYPFEDHGIKFHSIDMAPVQDLRTTSRLPIDTYTRLLFPAHFSGTYDRILYMDGDTYLRKPGLDTLLSMDMDDYALAAAMDTQDIIPWYEADDKKNLARQKYLGDLGLTGAQYQNSGVALINVNEFIKQNVFERVKEYAIGNPEKLQFADQSAINGALQGDWLQLSSRWNLQRVKNIELVEAVYDPTIVHFCGPKPWEDTDQDWLNSYRDEYVTFLSKEFPESSVKRNLEVVPTFTWRERYVRYKMRNEMLKRFAEFERNCKI